MKTRAGIKRDIVSLFHVRILRVLSLKKQTRPHRVCPSNLGVFFFANFSEYNVSCAIEKQQNRFLMVSYYIMNHKSSSRFFVDILIRLRNLSF